MQVSLALFAATVAAATAFAPNPPQTAFRSDTALRMSTEAVPIVVTGNNIELTPAIEDYVNKKLENTVSKLASSGAVKDCAVHLVVNKNPKVEDKHKAEVVTTVKGTVIRCAEESNDMYKSIDEVCRSLNRKLVKYKERRMEGYHGGEHMGEAFADALNAIDGEEMEDEDVSEDEEYVDPWAPVVTKTKSYDLSKPISLKEAIFSLDYIDHDFYVFRNEDSGEINVVYKRNEGGVGLIEPQ